MGKRTKTSFQKREREKAKQQKRRDKEEQRLLNKQQRAEAEPVPEGVDPDLAGIKPGPQPLPEQWHYADEPTEKSEDSV